MSMKESVTAQDVCDLLNGLLKRDPKAIASLVNNRVPCNDDIANHPTVQVHDIGDGEASLGLIGILNGLFGVDKGRMGPILMTSNQDDVVLGFGVKKSRGRLD